MASSVIMAVVVVGLGGLVLSVGCASGQDDLQSDAESTASGAGPGSGGGSASASSSAGGAGGVGATGSGGAGGAGGTGCPSELCDGVDNDCDDEVDEGCTCIDGDMVPCYSGPAGTEGVGTCTPGAALCDLKGELGACVGEVLPTAETCNNGLDDDCNAAIDEGCGCMNGDMQPCYSGDPNTLNVGECVGGVQTCNGGSFGPCVGDVLPSPETCDGADEDCDGSADEGNPGGGGACMSGLPGICGPGTLTCENSDLVCVHAMPGTETCNALDDDCNGSVDDAVAGVGGSCMSGIPGVCAAGTAACQNGMLDCIPNVQPGSEVCGDALDNDCDGETDECLPQPPGNPHGCSFCSCCDPWGIAWSASPNATYYVVRWKCSVNPEQVYNVGNVTSIFDVCNDIQMCNGMCAFTVGYIKVEACNGDGCSAPVNIPANDIPITCGGGCCC